MAVKKFRSFYERVAIRWGRPWGLHWERWVEDQRPCLACKSAVLLKVEILEDVPVALTAKPTAREARFVELMKMAKDIAAIGYWDGDAVPAWCRKRKVYIDANRSSKDVFIMVDSVLRFPTPCGYFVRRSHSRPAQMTMAEVVNE